MKATLTVGIPTFNGEKYIAQAIESVLENTPPDLKGRVDILVSDNASSDRSAEIVAALVDVHPEIISLRRNPHNIGFDANVHALFGAARGDFVHILGDDDYIEPGGLRALFEVLDAQPDVSVVVGQVTFLDIMSGVRAEGQRYDASAPLDGDSFFRTTKWGTAAVSSLVVRRQDWLGSDLQRYIGTQWIHVAALINILADEDTWGVTLPHDFVTVRVSNPRWSSNYGNQLRTGMEHLALLEEMTQLGYQPATFSFYIGAAPRARDIIQLRSPHLAENLQTMTTMRRFFSNRWQFWVFSVPALLLPEPFVRLGTAARGAVTGLVRAWTGRSASRVEAGVAAPENHGE